MKRRHVLLGGAAALALPLYARRAQAADVDVVVIGAGAAGIAAARKLRESGLAVLVVEAAARIGGRVHTDTAIFGAPYDIGAHWLHYAEANPFVDYGRANGFSVYPAPDEDVLRIGAADATAAEYRAFEEAQRAAVAAISRAGRAGQDVAPADVVPELGEWGPTVHLATGPYEMAKDFAHFSCADWWSSEDGADYYCREGFGTLFAHSAQDVPVTLNTRATQVRWGGEGVDIVTDQGTISARAAVVTVSCGVLAKEGVAFDPPLPAATVEAFHQLTMGHYTHVTLRLSDNFFGVGEDGYFYYKVDEEVNGSPKGFAALVDASGTGLTYCDLGGDFARQMAEAGAAATLDFVVSELTRLYGGAVRRAVADAHVAEWTTNPLTEGAYASAEPGGAGARVALSRPVGERIWFAGEALSASDWATVAGAHKSGEWTATSVARALGA